MEDVPQPQVQEAEEKQSTEDEHVDLGAGKVGGGSHGTARKERAGVHRIEAVL